MRKLMIIAAASLALASCGASTTTAPTSAGGVAVVADKVLLTGARGFGAAEVVFKAASDILQEQLAKGRFNATQAAWIRDRAIEARKLLVTGKATLDTAEKARAAARLFEIASLFDNLTGGK